MIDPSIILAKPRVGDLNIVDDMLHNGMRINRLFGLQTLIKENLNKESVVCEIGSYYGNSSSLFAYYCKKVYCVDIFFAKYYEDVFDKNMLEFKNIVKIKDTSINASLQFPDNSFDMVYIDAAHDYKSVKDDITKWLPKIKQKGFLAGHDFHYVSGSEVIDVLRDLNIIPEKFYEDSSWIKKIG